MGEGGEGRAKAERGENEGSEGRTREAKGERGKRRENEGRRGEGAENERRAKLTKWGGQREYI